MPNLRPAILPAFIGRNSRATVRSLSAHRQLAAILAAALAVTTYAVSTMAATATNTPQRSEHALVATRTAGSQSVVGFAARPGYRSGWVADRDGSVVAYGGAPTYGHAPANWGTVAGIAAAPDGDGYWLVTTRGKVKAFGSARLHSAGGKGHCCRHRFWPGGSRLLALGTWRRRVPLRRRTLVRGGTAPPCAVQGHRCYAQPPGLLGA